MNLKNTSKHKLIVVFLSLIMVFSMTSCGTKEATSIWKFYTSNANKKGRRSNSAS